MIEQIEATIDRKVKWRGLDTGETASMRVLTRSLLFGMILSLSSTAFYKYRCLACDRVFTEVVEAQDHECLYEVEFRQLTHRTKELFEARQAAGEIAYSPVKPQSMSVEQQGTFVVDTVLENRNLKRLNIELENSIQNLMDAHKIAVNKLEHSENVVAHQREQLEALRSARIQRDNQEPYR